MTNLDRVMDFIHAWERRDTEGVLARMTENAFYHNMPMAPLVGHAAIKGFIAPFLAMATKVEWIVHQAAENAQGTVLTERTDIFHLANGKTIKIPVMGTFEFEGGLIAKWRDYFDLAQFQRQMA